MLRNATRWAPGADPTSGLADSGVEGAPDFSGAEDVRAEVAEPEIEDRELVDDETLIAEELAKEEAEAAEGEAESADEPSEDNADSEPDPEPEPEPEPLPEPAPEPAEDAIQRAKSVKAEVVRPYQAVRDERLAAAEQALAAIAAQRQAIHDACVMTDEVTGEQVQRGMYPAEMEKLMELRDLEQRWRADQNTVNEWFTRHAEAAVLDRFTDEQIKMDPRFAPYRPFLRQAFANRMVTADTDPDAMLAYFKVVAAKKAAGGKKPAAPASATPNKPAAKITAGKRPASAPAGSSKLPAYKRGASPRELAILNAIDEY